MLCTCLLLMCACSVTSVNNEQSRVSIWYINGDVLEPLLKERCRQIQAENDNIIIELAAFESMEELSLTLQGKRPDLLLCSHELAFSLEEQGMLKSLKVDGLDYDGKLRSRYSSIGSSFFPVGAAVELLCCRESLPDTAQSSFEALCTYFVQNEKLLTIDSLARFMGTALRQSGGELSLKRIENAANQQYRYIHNHLAETALGGSLSVFDEGGAQLVRQGRVDAAIVASTGLVSVPSGVYITAVPVLAGGEKLCVADMRGFAYLGNTYDNSRATAYFIGSLLADGGAGELALQAGLVSPQTWDGANSGSELEDALYEIYSNWEMVLPSPVSPEVMIRQELEEELSAALEYLQ